MVEAVGDSNSAVLDALQAIDCITTQTFQFSADVAARTCELLLAVGTTLGVYPAAGVVPIAKRHGARIVIVNGEPTEMDHLADAVLRDSISDVLPALVGMSTA